MKINETIILPILTEKTTKLVADNYYSFRVNKKANKNQIKAVIENLYPVKVEMIKIIVRKGKIKKVGRRMTSKKMPDTKIAYIKLKSGKIDLFPQA